MSSAGLLSGWFVLQEVVTHLWLQHKAWKMVTFYPKDMLELETGEKDID